MGVCALPLGICRPFRDIFSSIGFLVFCWGKRGKGRGVCEFIRIPSAARRKNVNQRRMPSRAFMISVTQHTVTTKY